MNRANMAKQITEVPMAGCKPKGMMKGGKVKAGFVGGGTVKATVDQSMCSPRKQMAMGKMQVMAKRPGLYANIAAKKKRIAAGSGEKMRKPGSKGAPTDKAFRESAKTAKKK
jgi:hypothetical protein